MTWEIVAGIIALVGFIISIGKIVANNTKALTKLECSLEAINEKIGRDEEDIDDLEKVAQNHEARITQLEK